MKKDDILRRIQRLLALTESPEKHEAISAARMAQKLMTRYNISMDEIGQTTERELCAVINKNEDMDPWGIRLANVVANNFCCKMMVIGGAQIAFFGYNEDIAVANEVFGFLCRAASDNAGRLLRSYPVRQKKILFDTYMKAFIDGVESALGEGSTALALVVPEEVEREFNQLMQEMGVNKRSCNMIVATDAKVIGQGYEDGRCAVHTRRVEKEAV